MKAVLLAALLFGAAALGAMPADARPIAGDVALPDAFAREVHASDLLEVEGIEIAQAGVLVSTLDEMAITLACVDGGCVGTPAACLAASSLVGGTCANREDRCHSDWWRYQAWEVEGHHAGDGAVQFYTQCGEDRVSVCDTVHLPHCQSDEPGSGEGTLGCFYVILYGNPTDIVGRCIDPVNPALVYEAVPAGTPFAAAERLPPT